MREEKDTQKDSGGKADNSRHKTKPSWQSGKVLVCSFRNVLI
eukprot:SAG31_NODE_24101_length_489_cov_0.892308_1_plen_41_part_10